LFIVEVLNLYSISLDYLELLKKPISLQAFFVPPSILTISTDIHVNNTNNNSNTIRSLRGLKHKISKILKKPKTVPIESHKIKTTKSLIQIQILTVNSSNAASSRLA
jgi:hypothetical protein